MNTTVLARRTKMRFENFRSYQSDAAAITKRLELKTENQACPRCQADFQKHESLPGQQLPGIGI
ncbi:hypothetical protein Pla52n_52430 [Stieleria varia]|uniref:Uncharacterized protein n=1 Tax=Stieleria varia TaxID=2528005 RepID=A0A5C6A3E1_9BACT|nr:hypothetical protein Pla52n_52430 [Stieleria varia]